MSLIKKFNGKKNVVAKQIRKYREEQDMSYEVLSAKLELMGISIHKQSLYDIENNKRDYQMEKEAREKRLIAYAEAIQKSTLESSSQIIKELVEERHRLGMTQQDIADITGILPSNLARLESGGRVPTLVVLQKYAAAVGKHIELKVCDGVE